MDDNGIFNLENLINHRPPLVTEQQIRTKVNGCVFDDVGEDPCEEAYRQVNCFFLGKPLVDDDKFES